jgi:hypothetical protein
MTCCDDSLQKPTNSLNRSYELLYDQPVVATSTCLWFHLLLRVIERIIWREHIYLFYPLQLLSFLLTHLHSRQKMQLKIWSILAAAAIVTAAPTTKPPEEYIKLPDFPACEVSVLFSS